MNARRHAVEVGLRRGLTETLLSLRSPQDQAFYVFSAVATVGYLYLRRNTRIEGTDLAFATLTLPSILAATMAFGLIVGPMFQLTTEREDGTLLRARAVPHGVDGYVAGQVLFHSASIAPGLLVILLPSALLFGDLMERGAHGWLWVLVMLALGAVALLPIGLSLGAVVPDVRRASTWGMLPLLVLIGISGIFVSMQSMWGWVQGIAQLFPVYWLGLGMRSAFLPESAASLEIGGSWRTTETVLVLAAWGVAGAVVTPRLLRRMARRQSGAAMAEAREAAAQWVK